MKLKGKVFEIPIRFGPGIAWDKRGSRVGEAFHIVDMQNAWMSFDEIGAIEAMPGDSSFINWSATTGEPLLQIAAGANVSGTDRVTKGTIGIVGVTESGSIEYANYSTVTDVGELFDKVEVGIPVAEFNLTGLVKFRDKFFLFFGSDHANPQLNKPMVSTIGSTAIRNIGLPRPDTSDPADIYIELNAGGQDNVVGVVRYWIAAIEEGRESGLSEQLSRLDFLPFHLDFGASGDSVDWGDVALFNINPTGVGDSFSIEFMVRAEQAPVGSRDFLFGKRNNITPTTIGWHTDLGTDGQVRFICDDGTSEYIAKTTTVVSDGLWHRISCTYDDTSEQMKIYRDGQLEATTNTNAPSLGDLTNTIAMKAGETGAGGNNFTGQMVDFRFWDAAITAGVINNDTFNRIVDPSTGYPDLVGYWPCNEGTGTTDALVDNDDSNNNPGDVASEDMWVADDAFGARSINCGTGSRVDIIFDDNDNKESRFYGKTFKIYRSGQDQAVPQYLTTFSPTAPASAGVDDTFNTFTDDIKDEDLGDLAFLHGDQPPSFSRAAVAHANRIFVAANNELYFSDVASPESYWTADNGNHFPIYPDDGDKITAMVSDYSGIVIFKFNHMYKLYGRTPDEFQLRPFSPSPSIPVSVGTPSVNSVCAIPDGLAFYWNRKVYLLRSGGLEKISDPIQEDLNALALIYQPVGDDDANNESVTVYMGYWAARNQLWLCIGDDDKTSDFSYIYDLTENVWIGKRDRGYSNPQSVRGTDVWVDQFIEEQFIGGITDDTHYGRVAKIIDESVNTLHSAVSYNSHVEFTPFFAGSLNKKKRFAWVDIVFEPQASGTFDFEYWIDGKTGSSTTVSGISMVETGTPEYGFTRINIDEVGYSLTIKFLSTPSTDGRFKIFGVTFGGQVLESVAT